MSNPENELRQIIDAMAGQGSAPAGGREAVIAGARRRQARRRVAAGALGSFILLGAGIGYLQLDADRAETAPVVVASEPTSSPEATPDIPATMTPVPATPLPVIQPGADGESAVPTATSTAGSASGNLAWEITDGDTSDGETDSTNPATPRPTPNTPATPTPQPIPLATPLPTTAAAVIPTVIPIPSPIPTVVPVEPTATPVPVAPPISAVTCSPGLTTTQAGMVSTIIARCAADDAASSPCTQTTVIVPSVNGTSDPNALPFETPIRLEIVRITCEPVTVTAPTSTPIPTSPPNCPFGLHTRPAAEVAGIVALCDGATGWDGVGQWSIIVLVTPTAEGVTDPLLLPPATMVTFEVVMVL